MLKINSSHSIRKFLAVAALAVASATAAHATTITFDDGLVTAGSVLSNQYAGLGVTFAPGGGATTGVVIPTADGGVLAPNTTMAISSVTTEGLVAPLSGLVLRSTNGWLAETGNPAFTMTFSLAITTLSIDFGAVGASIGQPSIYAVNPATGIAIAVGAPTLASGTVNAVGLPAGTKTVVVLPGNYNDYVAIDNIVFSAVPEPSTVAASVLGLGALGLVVRRRRAQA